MAGAALAIHTPPPKPTPHRCSDCCTTLAGAVPVASLAVSNATTQRGRAASFAAAEGDGKRLRAAQFSPMRDPPRFCRYRLNPVPPTL
jgi:hypothetical protein